MMALSSSTQPQGGAGHWRQLASALKNIDDFDRFTGAMQAALSSVDDKCLLSWSATEVKKLSEDNTGLSAPIEVEGRVAGFVNLRPARRFGAQDLHLLGDLADFLSTVLALSLKTRRDADRRGLLRLLLDQAPVGIVALRKGEIIAENGLAERWLSELGTHWLKSGTHVHQGSVSGHLIFAEVRDTNLMEDLRIAVLHDLTPNQARILESLQTAYYRARAIGKPAAFALFESPEASGTLFRAQGDIMRSLGAEAKVGPYDSTRLAAVVDCRGPVLRSRLRQLCTSPIWERTRLSIINIAVADNPENVIERAIAERQPIADLLRPRVVVADESRSVRHAVKTMLDGVADVIGIEPERLQDQIDRPDIDALLLEYGAKGVNPDFLYEIANTPKSGVRLAYSLSSPLSLAPNKNLTLLAKPFAKDALRQALLPIP